MPITIRIKIAARISTLVEYSLGLKFNLCSFCCCNPSTTHEVLGLILCYFAIDLIAQNGKSEESSSSICGLAFAFTGALAGVGAFAVACGTSSSNSLPAS